MGTELALRAVAWWGFAHVTRPPRSLFGMYGSVPDLISIDLANALLFTAFAMTWTGARVFDGRQSSRFIWSPAPFSGCWCAACRWSRTMTRGC